MPSLPLTTSIARLKGMSAYFSERLAKLGILTARDLLFHFPYRYEDFSRVVPIAALEEGKSCTIRGIVEKIDTRRLWKRRMVIVEARVADASGKVTIVWFNQSYVGKSLSAGVEANFAGRVTERAGKKTMTNPLYETVKSGNARHTAGIIPIYRETKGLTSKGLRFFIQPVLESVNIPETLPAEILEKEKLLPAGTALRTVHFPESIGAAYAAKKRFAFEELLLLSVHMGMERKATEAKKAMPINISPEEIKEFLALVPFPLTESQKRALWETAKDMGRSFPMHRLLQGDVGSGKTIVAALASALTAQKGLQIALMAPTEILARQHYMNFVKLFDKREFGIALLTAGSARASYGAGLETEMQKKSLLSEIKNGKIKIVIGTHALLEKKASFKNLALAIVDEQHRFGVAQRAKLLTPETAKEFTPHFLSMSATPIPRTLSLTLFADLDLSLITELPKNRKPIETRLIPKEGRTKAYEAIREEIKKGRQVFVICPRIDPPEEIPLTEKETQALEIKSVKMEYEKLSKKIFPNLSVAMLHGKMKATEKEKIMDSFAKRETDILISTSVIEVGIDVPNATIMMVEDAERFGLAQLYQFRGRVGRGIHQSYCFLFTEKEEEETLLRLSYLEKAKNGFELAEYDLKTRGPGQFFGIAQSGFPDLAMAALQNPEMLKSAKAYAEDILENDPLFKKYPSIREKIEEFSKGLHRE